MNTRGFFAERLYPVLFMVVLTTVCISMVSGISLVTGDRVRINETLFLKRAILSAAGLELPATPEEVESLYISRVRESEDNSYFAVLSGDGDQTRAFVLVVTGPGLWGEIEAVIGYLPDGKTHIAIEFTKQNETPGLGARINEEWFGSQVEGKHAPFTLVDEGTQSTVPTEIDAITGATITSRYIRDLLNESAQRALSLAEGGR